MQGGSMGRGRGGDWQWVGGTSAYAPVSAEGEGGPDVSW